MVEWFITKLFDKDINKTGYLSYSEIKDILFLCKATLKDEIIRNAM